MSPTPPTEEQLAAAAQAGDDGGLAELVRRVYPALRRWALCGTGDAQQGEDAAQDALVRLLRSLPRYDPTRPFRPWLRTLARAAAADRVRDAHRAVPLPMRPASPDPDRALDLARGAAQARRGFDALSPRQRELWILVDREGLTPTEAAARLGIAPSTARVQLHRARKTLRLTLLADQPEILALLQETP